MHDEQYIPQKKPQKAWVVFSGQADLPWLKILKKGFRHCYVLLNDEKHWITVDPLSNVMDVNVHDLPPDFDLPLWMKNQGYVIIPTYIQHQEKQAPWMPFSCVEAVKRVLGIHNAMMFTPWQLYKCLRKNSENNPTPKSQSIKGDFIWEA
ncbi:MAG: hypothetical protein AB8B83_07230 [Bdellovibrionales bacterium]